MNLTESQPKSHQVAQFIKQEIKQGHLKPGDRLPSVRKLAETLSVGRQVVLSAFELLVKESVLRSRVGQGTFVNPEFTFQSENTILRMGLYCHRLNWDSINNSSLLTGVSEAALELKHEVITAHSLEGLDLVSWSKNHALHGMLLTGKVDDALIELAEASNIPFVVIGNYELKTDVNVIEIDLIETIQQTIEAAIIKFSIHHLAAIVGPEQYLSSQQIVEAIRDVTENGSQQIQFQCIFSDDENGYREMEELFSHPNKPDAVLVVRQAYSGAARWLFENKHCMPAKPVIITAAASENDLLYPDIIDIIFTYNTYRKAKFSVQKLELLITDNNYQNPPIRDVIKGTFKFI